MQSSQLCSLRLSGTTGFERYALLVSGAARIRTPGTKYAGGHRIRVTPVPIPNTEVKPDTADGTAWETVWESRSLPAVFVRMPASRIRFAGFFVPAAQWPAHSFPCAAWPLLSGASRPARRGCGRVGRCRQYWSACPRVGFDSRAFFRAGSAMAGPQFPMRCMAAVLRRLASRSARVRESRSLPAVLVRMPASRIRFAGFFSCRQRDGRPTVSHALHGRCSPAPRVPLGAGAGE